MPKNPIGASATTKIPRPMNCFLAFRLAKQKEILSKYSGANHRDISKILAKLWKESSEEEKKPYREHARLAKMEHARLYPDYRYKPKRKGERQRRRYTRRTVIRDLLPPNAQESDKQMDNLFKNPGLCSSELSPCGFRSSLSPSIGNEIRLTNDYCIHDKCQCYSSRLESPSLSDCPENLCPPLSFSPDLPSFVLSSMTPNDRSPPLEYLFHPSQDELRQQQKVYIGNNPSTVVKVPDSFIVQHPNTQEMTSSTMSTSRPVPFGNACKVQVYVATDHDYLDTRYPLCYYTCPPNL